jgi:hypothetical protein
MCPLIWFTEFHSARSVWNFLEPLPSSVVGNNAGRFASTPLCSSWCNAFMSLYTTILFEYTVYCSFSTELIEMYTCRNFSLKGLCTPTLKLGRGTAFISTVILNLLCWTQSVILFGSLRKKQHDIKRVACSVSGPNIAMLVCDNHELQTERAEGCGHCSGTDRKAYMYLALK